MNKKVSLGVTISIAAIVCALTFIVTSFLTLRRFNTKVQAVKEKAEKYDRLVFAIGCAAAPDGREIRAALQSADERMYADKKRYYDAHPERSRRVN